MNQEQQAKFYAWLLLRMREHYPTIALQACQLLLTPEEIKQTWERVKAYEQEKGGH